MSDDENVDVPPVSELYRRRVRFEWTVVCLIAISAAAVVVASWTPLPGDAVTLFSGLLAVAVLAGGAVLAAFLFRTLPASAHITRSADRDVTAAAKNVRRGKPVHPPQLQADAITSSRRDVRTSLFTMGFQPVLAASWTLQTGPPALAGFLNVVGPIVIALVLAALAWLGLLQHRLDTLERRTREAPAGALSAGAPTAPGDGPGPPGRASSP